MLHRYSIPRQCCLAVLALSAVLPISATGPVEAKVGEKAPNFTLTDQQGNPVSLADFADKVVVLEWTNPDCPFVKRHYNAGTMKKLASKYGHDGVVWLAINSSHYASTKDNAEFVAERGLAYPVLDDRDGKVGRMYGAKTTPHMYVIDKGVLAYVGAIDDDPRGSGASVNYVDQALAEIAAGKPVSQPQRQSYGCSVKYGQ